MPNMEEPPGGSGEKPQENQTSDNKGGPKVNEVNDAPPTYDPGAMDKRIFEHIAQQIQDEKTRPVNSRDVPDISPASSLLKKLPPKRPNPHNLHVVKSNENPQESDSGSQNAKPPSGK